jgi:2-oxo-4-hydroxy-4-carboxy-5-ureidoimidazoline decarboxylase
MAEPHALLSGLAAEDARAALLRCCGSRRWVEGMLARRPFADAGALLAAADEVWGGLAAPDFLEAFTHHPRIGASVDELREKFRATSRWSGEEQGGVAEADAQTLEALAALNADYAARFGFIFIVCATGKSAAEMLALLQARIHNEPEAELRIAAGEQAKITRLRLEKLAP